MIKINPEILAVHMFVQSFWGTLESIKQDFIIEDPIHGDFVFLKVVIRQGFICTQCVYHYKR